MPHDSSSPHVGLTPAADSRLSSLEAQILALQAAADQARALFQQAPHAAFLINAQGRVVDVNEQGAALLGSAAALVQGRPLPTAGSSSSLEMLLARVFGGAGRQSTEVQLAGPGGEPVAVVLAARLHLRDGESLCQVSATDVSAFRAAHQTLLEATRQQDAEFQQLSVKFRHLGEEFRSVMVTSEQKLSTTLTRAQNFLTLLDRQEDPEERQRSLRHVTAAVQQTQGLLDSLKTYMQARTLRARTRSVDLNRVLKAALKDMEGLKGDRDVQITQMLLPTVQGDHQVLQLILHEYLANALKFTRPRPLARLHVLTQETDTEHWIGVEDNGVGFNLRQKDKAFELFGRLHPERLYEGTGLGLAVVRRLCERFGGRAWGEGRVEQGATFWFAWPKVPVTD